MITKDDMIPMLITACPSFLPVFEALDDEDKSIHYPIIGGLFANHLLTLYRNKQTQEFSVVAKVIEQFHIDGDEYVREAATIGYLKVFRISGRIQRLILRYLRNIFFLNLENGGNSSICSGKVELIMWAKVVNRPYCYS